MAKVCNLCVVESMKGPGEANTNLLLLRETRRPRELQFHRRPKNLRKREPVLVSLTMRFPSFVLCCDTDFLGTLRVF